jgi:hypothetical protein
MHEKDDWNTLLAYVYVSGILGLFVGIARGIIQQKHGSFGAFFRGVVASVFVAILVSWGITDAGLTVTTKGVIVGVCAFIADDILLGLLSLGALIGKDPLGFLSRLLAAYRGQSAQVQPPPAKDDLEPNK